MFSQHNSSRLLARPASRSALCEEERVSRRPQLGAGAVTHIQYPYPICTLPVQYNLRDTLEPLSQGVKPEYRVNLASLRRLVLVMFLNDTMVEPKESSACALPIVLSSSLFMHIHMSLAPEQQYAFILIACIVRLLQSEPDARDLLNAGERPLRTGT